VYGYCSLFYGSDGIGLVYGVLVASNAPGDVRYIMFAHWSYWSWSFALILSTMLISEDSIGR